MAQPPVRALILAGGSGTRLWPLSTDARPKPFLHLAGERSLLAEAFRRAARLVGEGNMFVSARASHAELVRRELPGLPESRLVLEPVRRNTAPAVALAALAVEAEAPGAVLVVLPSDQAARDEELNIRSCGLYLAWRKSIYRYMRQRPTTPLGLTLSSLLPFCGPRGNPKRVASTL